MGEETLFGRNPYASITRMMQEAKKGLCFPMKGIMKVYEKLDTLSSVKDGFYAVQQFLTILYELSKCLRLGYAARMLVDTAKSISEIGFDCGFNNLSNFNRIFKKKKGCSPSEFRENYHKTRIII